MTIDILTPGELSGEDIAAWTGLQDQSGLLNPFFSPHWVLACARAKGPDQRHAKLAVLRDSGETVGFFPARVSGGAAMPVGAPMCDYQGLVAAPGVSVEARRLVEALGVQRLDFSHMLADQAAFAPYARGEVTSYVLDVAEGYAAYETQRRTAGSGVLKDIDKRRRKVEREVGPVRFTALADCPNAFATLLDWKRKQYLATGQTVIFDAPWTVELLRDLHGRSGGDFGGALFCLHIGDQLAAIQFHLRGARTLHAWIIAHDEAFERYSPGLILFQEILRWMDETPFTSLDLGAGDYRFKLQLANLHRPVAHGFVGRPSTASLVRGAQYGVRAAAERLPWPQVSVLPAKAMRRLDLWRGLR